jgi:hypothetical protein
VSAHDPHASPSIDGLVPLEGGASTLRIAAVLGVLGLGATAAAGFMGDSKEALVSYLVAFAYWCGLSLGGLFLVMIFNTAGARWTVVLRRAMETLTSALPLFVLLFLPIALGAKSLYVWLEPGKLVGEAKELVEHKHVWLNQSSFFVRAAVYFAIFVVLQHLLYGWSVKQDGEGSAALTRSQRRLSTGGLPILALAFTVAGVDWLMTLEPTFSSTIFGVYYFAGSFLGAIVLLVVGTALARGVPSGHAGLVSTHHWHNLGKLCLAFTSFWAYIAVSQYLLIWIANLPEEIPWYILRTQGPWTPVFVALCLGQFVLPFFTLLSRDIKLQPSKMLFVGLWIMAAHWLDLFWLVVPAFNEQPHFHWTQLTAFVGVGGAAVAFALFRARGKFAVPVGDPYLDDSLRYTQP